MRRLAAIALFAVLPFHSSAGQDARPPALTTEVRGHLTPKRFTTLSTEVAAKIERVSVREGERFKDGAPLVTLDCSVLRAQLDRARGILAAAEKLLAAQRNLVQLKSAGELEADMAALEVARARGEVVVVQANLNKCAIAAPFAGRVIEQKVRDQQFVQPGQPLLEILDDSALEIEFIAPSKWMADLKPGQAFRIQVEELGTAFPARIIRLSARVDPVSLSIKVVGEVVGNHPDLIAGMSGRILLSTSTTAQ